MKNTVIIADDSQFMRHWIKEKIEQHHYQVVAEAKNGLEAVRAYLRHKPNIVIMDIVMPNSNGIDALIKIKEIDPKANVIMSSSLATNENVMKALNYGASEFIVKPHFDNLIEVMNNSLEQK
ncbi:response regulator [Gracilibacillus sp. S3-1-1]|uniref:Response regulator n=1 Tax=Gracilibacillus pellucidus TaxID=3095368 RepID=A0ACC6M3T7_9BACI|nr:response regulator [Gracilibacillus sp. S3-1-1]MDX8045630.1 response regulator [Gracilibacillus sp. S3-1-1]